MAIILPDGYVFCLTKKRNWRTAKDDYWETEVWGPEEGEELPKAIGKRGIDGSTCVVFLCADGKYRAALEVSCYR